MRMDRKAGDVERKPLIAVDDASLAKAKGGLKAERIQGADPTCPGGN
jgi:hypothetical protein